MNKQITTVEFVLKNVKESLVNNQTINYQELVKIILRSQQYDITSAQYENLKVDAMTILNEVSGFDIKKFDEAAKVQFKVMKDSQAAWQPALRQIKAELRASKLAKRAKLAAKETANSFMNQQVVDFHNKNGRYPDADSVNAHESVIGAWLEAKDAANN